MYYDGTWNVHGGGIFGLLIIGLIIYLVVRPNSHSTSSYRSSDRSLELLKERYAKGEISDEEYERKKRNLRD